MHIPDGYLSPTTCVVGYAVAAPFWYIAVKRVRRLLNSRVVPLISVFSAFSFVIMMFNLPLPGGTTGHAVGIGIATIVLGPWAAILAVSIALLIQALFFGDGGITTYGFNSVNLAIVGAFVTYGVYRLTAAGAELNSMRRVVAAAGASYLAINAGAFCVALELGVQPMLFHTVDGTPLYAPYPLSVSIPAMMIGHITIAGLAELVVTAGIVSYLHRADPALLRTPALDAGRMQRANSHEAAGIGGPRLAHRLWFGVAILMLLVPLGLLAAGAAWGEWQAADFANPAARADIEAASGQAAAPAQAPAGLQRLSSVWTAPIPDYAPTFMRSEAFGYILSSIVGVGLIILVFLTLAKLAGRTVSEHGSPPSGSGR